MFRLSNFSYFLTHTLHQSGVALKLVKNEVSVTANSRKPYCSSKNKEKVTEPQLTASWRFVKVILTIFGISFTCLGSCAVYVFGAAEIDTDGNRIRDDLERKPLLLQYIIRTYRELIYFKKLIQQPSRNKLLPDPLGLPYAQPKYTLVLELTGVLVHPDWTYYTGWRFKKRPFLTYFLETLRESYEIVIYTAEQGVTVFPLIEAIDPDNIIAYKLVRDATYFTGGYHVKSLDNLNRDLSKVICIDWDSNNLKLNTSNLLKVKRWSGNDDDSALIDLAAMLKTIADNGIDDVREVLQYYSKYDDPVGAFREKQKHLIEALEAHAAAKRAQDQHIRRFWSPAFFTKRPTRS